MKTFPFVFAASLALTFAARSQTESTVDSETTVADISPTAARILGTIPDGTPPPPAPPKPTFVVPAKDVLSSKIHQEGGRTITVREIKPISLPPPPPPPAATPSPEEEAAFREQLAEYRNAHPRSGLLILSATVFRSNDSPPRTLVRCWPEGSGQTITFWSSADFALIAGGINSFVDSAGQTHHLLMGWGNVELERMSDLFADNARRFAAPEMPDFPEDNATYHIAGPALAAEDLTTIQSLHDLYNSEHARLKIAMQGREQARLAREEELRLHPPKPKDIVLNFWRTETPAPTEGGAK